MEKGSKLEKISLERIKKLNLSKGTPIELTLVHSKIKSKRNKIPKIIGYLKNITDSQVFVSDSKEYNWNDKFYVGESYDIQNIQDIKPLDYKNK